MNVRNFIGASSFVLLSWLGATYLHEVPSERYPQQTKTSLTASANSVAADEELIANIEPEVSENR